MGFEKWRFVRNQIPDQLTCKICKLVLQQPVQCRLCAKFYCKECVLTKAPEGECPHPEEILSPVNHFLLLKLKSLTLYCQYKKFGCNFSSIIPKVQKHENNCKYKKVAETEVKELRNSPQRVKTVQFINLDELAIICPKGCGVSLKSSEVDTHSCIESLQEQLKRKKEQNRRLEQEFGEIYSFYRGMEEEFTDYQQGTQDRIIALETEFQDIRKKVKDLRHSHAQVLSSTQREYDSNVYNFRTQFERKIDQHIQAQKDTLKSFAGKMLQNYHKFAKTDIQALNYFLITLQADFQDLARPPQKKPFDCIRKAQTPRANSANGFRSLGSVSTTIRSPCNQQIYSKRKG